MKLSFSTLGCPGWTNGEMLSAAADLGYDGIEYRAVGSFSDNAPAIERLAADCAKKGKTLVCIATDAQLQQADGAQDTLARAYIELAGRLAVPYLRVMGDKAPMPGDPVDFALLQQRLQTLAPIAAAAGVVLLVETNGALADTSRLRCLMEAVDSAAVQVLWDLHHPFRYFGETPMATYANIGAYVRHVHIKDSQMKDGVLTYKMLGYGDLPYKDAIALLTKGGYDGFYSLEWTKLWNRELEDAGVVFSHFAYAMQKKA